MAQRRLGEIQSVSEKIKSLEGGLSDVLDGIFSNYSGNNSEYIELMLWDIFPAVAETAQTASANMASTMYDAWRSDDLGESAELRHGFAFDAGKYSSAVNTAIKKLEAGDVDGASYVMSEYAGRTVREAYSDTLLKLGSLDSRKPKYARVPTSREACDFCLVLASRDFERREWKSGEKAHNHSHCGCVYVASWDKNPTAEGYDPGAYYRVYRRKATAEMLGTGLYDGDVSKIDREVKKISKGYEAAWGEYSLQKKSAARYLETVGEYVKSFAESGKISVEPFCEIKAKEIQAAKWLSRAGIDLEFRNPKSDGISKKNTSDVFMRGGTWDIKRIESKNPSKIKARVVEKIDRQGPNFVIDLSISKMTTAEAENEIAWLMERDDVNDIIMIKNGRAKLFKK